MYSTDELEAKLKSTGIARDDYPAIAARALARTLVQEHDGWIRLGPYWGVVQRVMFEYEPGVADGWGTPPDYLSGYDTGDDALNMLAAIAYLNSNGDYLPPLHHPHSIQVGGNEYLYHPQQGLIET